MKNANFNIKWQKVQAVNKLQLDATGIKKENVSHTILYDFVNVSKYCEKKFYF